MTNKPSEVDSRMNNQYNIQRLLDFVELRGDGRELYKQVFSHIRRYIGGNYDDAEDIIVDVQLKVWQNRDQYNPERRLESWIFRIATNACIDFYRRNVSLDRLTSLGILELGCEEDQEGLERAEDIERIKSEIPYLPEAHRQVIDLVYLQGLKYREAAEVMQIPVGTVKSKLHQGMLLLRTLNNERKVA